MNIADAQERRDVRLMRLRGQRITEEYDRQHLILSDPGADLQVAPLRTRLHQLDVEAQLGPQARARRPGGDQREDRKSTRLNSSHVAISYAVFCLKKKK